MCCHGGKAVPPPLTPMPAFLYGLYLGRHALSSDQVPRTKKVNEEHEVKEGEKKYKKEG